jgi:hypothetical protein
MLGEKIGEFTGKSAMPRVLKGDDPRYVKMEFTFQDAGKLLGQDAMQNGTYTVWERVPNQLYGEGQGTIMTTAGDSLIWNGHGIGQPTGQGLGIRFAFSVAVQASEKLGQLNNILVVGEHEVDSDGNTRTSMWEWK